jgi:transposase InsO family protein
MAEDWVYLSPRTVRKYWPWPPSDAPGERRRRPSQNWSTFIRNHASAIVASDFLVAVTARFQVLYVLLILEVGSRRILQRNVTAHPTSEWRLQQFREALPLENACRFVIHDRDAIFSEQLDEELEKGFGVRVLRTPPQSPQANAFCERLVGTMRRECLDFLIPLNEKHLRRLLMQWVRHYNSGRPHSSVGPGIPERYPTDKRRRCNRRARVAVYDRHNNSELVARPILGGLHHEYAWKQVAA